jgi:hypothetical protein
MSAKRNFPGEVISDPLAVRAMLRDPEDRPVPDDNLRVVREKMLDKTLADSYPASDPPSTIPDPSTDSVALSHRPPWNFDKAA